MDLLSQRQKSNDELLQNRFVARILQEEAQSIDTEQIKLMQARNFLSSEFYSNRNFNVDNTILRYQHLAKHRFVDMKTRQTKNGQIKKVSHPIHNRILFGHANNIIFRLSFEYTSRMKTMLATEFKIEL